MACPARNARPRRPSFSLALRLALILFGTLLSASLPAHASRVRPVNLEEMTQRAARIFSGRCVDVRVERDPDLDQMVTHVTFAVTRAVKGGPHGQVTIKMLGDQEADADEGGRAERDGGKERGIEGLPRFRRGEEVVLFLYGESRSGLTSPVGFGQGKFTLIKDKQGQRLAVNGSGNAHLFRGLSAEARRRLGDAEERFKGRKGIALDALLDMAVSLGR